MVSSFTVVNHTNSNEGEQREVYDSEETIQMFVLAVAGADVMRCIAAPLIGSICCVLHSGTGRPPGDL